MIGTVVGNYRIVGKIAVGGMGTVFRAEHTLIGRMVAVKILNPEMSANRDIVNRFFNEAKATSTVNHPGIVEVFDFGFLPSGNAYLVMELLAGETLSQRMRARGRMSEGEAAMVMRGVCTALAAAHAKGIVHRDLKPDNIFLVPDPDSQLGERTKLLDFGIAKLTDIGLAGSATRTGAVMGTPTYMSPEQCRGTGDVDHRADLYSIGGILYELVSGRPPFVNRGAGELIGAHLFVDPEPVSRHAQVSPELERLIMSLLAKQPERRVQTALELADQLVQIAQGQGWVAVTNTDPSLRASMHAIQPPASAAPMLTPIPHGSVLTPMHTPAPATPAASDSGAPTEIAVATTAPTTLSGAASQAAPAPSTHSRKALAIALSIGGGLFAVAIGIAIAIGTSGGPADGSSGGSASGEAAREQREPRAATPTPSTPPPVVAPAAPPADARVEAPPPSQLTETEPAAAPSDSEEPVDTTEPADLHDPGAEPSDDAAADGTAPASPASPPSPPSPSTQPARPTRPARPAKPERPRPAKPAGGDLLETEL